MGDRPSRTPKVLGDRWPRLPPEIAVRMRPLLADAERHITETVRREVADYARPRDARYELVIREGVRDALEMFVGLIEDPDASWGQVRDTFHRIGRGELREGRDPDVLYAALRVGSRAGWNRLVGELVARGDIDQETLGTLGEAMFLFMEQLAAAGAAGHAEAREGRIDLRGHRRSLVQGLTDDPPLSPEALTVAAEAAHWPVPEELAAVALAPRHPDRDTPPPLAPAGLLDSRDGDEPFLLMPDPDPARAERLLAPLLRDWMITVAPGVEPRHAARSLRWARDLLALVQKGSIDGAGIVHCADHLVTMMIIKDRPLLDALAPRYLAPLETLRKDRRERMEETLLAWLRCEGNIAETAARLHLHPQTVRYRVRQIEDTFGDTVHDRPFRFELEIVLTAARLLRPAEAP